MKALQVPQGVPYGKTVGQVRRENPDLITALSWKTAPPCVPKQEGLLGVFAASATRPCPELSDLVIKREVSVDEARAVYSSWIHAQHQMRKLLIQNNLSPDARNEMLALLRHDYWSLEGSLSTGQNLKRLAEDIEHIEQSGFKITSSEMHTLLSGPLRGKDRSVRMWLVDFWIKQEDESTPPLCMCTDGLLDELVKQRQVAFSLNGGGAPEWENPPVGELLRKAISRLGLERASIRIDVKSRKRKAPLPPIRKSKNSHLP